MLYPVIGSQSSLIGTFFFEAQKKRVQEPVAAFSRGRPWFWSWLFRRRGFSMQPGPPAPRPTFEDMTMVQEAVQDGGDCRRVAEEISPVVDGPVRSHQRAGAFISAHDDLQQLFRRCGP